MVHLSCCKLAGPHSAVVCPDCLKADTAVVETEGGEPPRAGRPEEVPISPRKLADQKAPTMDEYKDMVTVTAVSDRAPPLLADSSVEAWSRVGGESAKFLEKLVALYGPKSGELASLGRKAGFSRWLDPAEMPEYEEGRVGGSTCEAAAGLWRCNASGCSLLPAYAAALFAEWGRMAEDVCATSPSRW